MLGLGEPPAAELSRYAARVVVLGPQEFPNHLGIVARYSWFRQAQPGKVWF
jgi:hypothetical protein